MNSSLFWGNWPVMFSSEKLVKIAMRRCECIHRWFRVCHKKNMSVLKKKQLSLDNSKLSKVFDLALLHLYHLYIHPIKPGNSTENLEAAGYFFQVVVSSPTGKHFTVLRLKTLFLQLRDFQNIGARLWQHEFHWRELWGNGWWMDQGDSTNCIIPI